VDLYKSTIRAYQRTLAKWTFQKPTSFSEDFAQKRFSKKFQEPDQNKVSSLAQKAWDDYLCFDDNLPSEFSLLPGEWYKARLQLHSLCRGRVDGCPIDFPKGSSFSPTGGLNSVESRLARGEWTCTPENFEKFSKLVYRHKALKRAFRRRYTRWFLRQKFKESFKESERILWNRFRFCPDPGFLIFQWKLERITTLVQGSRFATVPKNNEVRRPINIEPFGNILNQRQIGNFLRKKLMIDMGVNLDTLADKHREIIRDHSYATIDLKNASDSIALCKFLLPGRFLDQLLSSRSPMLLGFDKMYHIPKKISSMGNGFTFELMTAILTCLARVLDPTASVFGDDIVIKKDCAPRLIQLLEVVGFVVNKEKSFIEGPFRESCGANHHIDEGYVKSYDFLWPESIGDCATILAKAYALGESYPSFKLLYDQLLKRTPVALRGGGFDSSLVGSSWDSPDLPTWFVSDVKKLPHPRKRVLKAIRDAYCASDVRIAQEFVFVSKEVSPSPYHLHPHAHWAKYEMYLSAGGRVKDVRTGEGRWAKRNVYFVDGMITRLSKEDLSDLLGEK